MSDLKTDTPSWGETAKLMFDYFKHLTTLSTGSVLLLVTFLEKLFENPEWKLLIAFSYAGFVLSILTSLIAMLVVGSFTRREHEPTNTEINFWAGGAITALASFFLGILCLTIFAVKNF